MLRHIQNIESVIITESDLKVFNNRLNSEAERLLRKDLKWQQINF